MDGMKKAAAENGVELVVLAADNNSTQQVPGERPHHAEGRCADLHRTGRDRGGGRPGDPPGHHPGLAVDHKPESARQPHVK
jgi:hypothetical protein